MTTEPKKREHWGTRIGLILAMAGNAVGLGNFLRFPVQAAENGGGTFMIPYFISFVLLGIPLMWMEWGIGRYGGRLGHGTLPGMFDSLWRHPVAKYLGVLGLAMPLIIFVYYTYVVGWMLGFSFLSLTGDYFGLTTFEAMGGYLRSFQDIYDSSFHGGWVAVVFYLLTMALVVYVIGRGISGGIEKLALVGMPILFLFALVLMVRVLTLPATELGSPVMGLNFIWQPEWDKLWDAKVWLAAAGQIFFTLSLGLGTIHTYASYLSEKDDITLTGLATASTNEFVEVVMGGTIAIPAAVTFFGVVGMQLVTGTFDLGIVAMSVVFQQLPGPELVGRLAGFMWFSLLFIAGITSSVAQASPTMAFFQEEFGLSRKRVAWLLGLTAIGLTALHVLFYRYGFMDEWDYWVGTFGLVVFAAVEVLVVWVGIGMERFWEELHAGADLRVARFFFFVMKWVTPLFLLVLLGWWTVTQAWPNLRMQGVAPEQIAARWLSRLVMVAIFAAAVYFVRRAWRRNPERHGRVGP